MITDEGDWAGSADGPSLMELITRTLDAIAKVDVASQRTANQRMAVEDLDLQQVTWILVLFDLDYVAAKIPEMNRAIATEAAIRDVSSQAFLRFL